MGNVVLIRHGQASFGEADYDRLSPLGEEQSRHLGQWFRQTHQHADLIATGSMRRHVRTAELCVEAAALDVPTVTVAGLNELDHVDILTRHRPDLDGVEAWRAEMARGDDPQQTFQRLFAAAIDRWTSGKFDAQYTRSWPEFRADVLQALQELAMHTVGTIWAFTSGGPIAVIAQALVGAPADNPLALSWPLVNTSLTRLSLGATRHSLVSYNSWPHLELTGESRLVTHR